MNRDAILNTITMLFILLFIAINSLLYFYHISIKDASINSNAVTFIVFIDLLLIFYYIYIYNKIKALTQSRNIFLRNIMHGLKTPITKGKIITETIDDNKKQAVLKRVFYRLEYILQEVAKVEELSSGEIVLRKKQFRVVDIIDQALDLLLLTKEKISICTYDTIITVDFELFSIAIKNLIENAIKYNTEGNPEIFIKKDRIIFKNRGTKLTKNVDEYYKAFNHEHETSKDSLGLGLYITKNIIKIHGFTLKYEYKDSYHYFSIVFS